MELILVRHGETKEGKGGIILGQLPGILTMQGRNFARNAGHAIAKLPNRPRLIFSSDLKRAKDTACIIVQVIRVPIKFDSLLQERKSGVAEGKKENQINWKEYEKKPLAYRRHESGESFIDVKKRAQTFLKKMGKEKKTPIVIVSHSAFLSMLLSILLGWSYTKALKFDFDNKIILVDTKKQERVKFRSLVLR